MIRHLALFTWKEHVTDADVEALTTELREMAAGLPVLVAYECGPALGLRPGADFGVSAVVRDAEVLAAYLDWPEHQDLYARRLGAMVRDRLSVQIDVGDPA